MKRRVVITGMGVVSPVGNTVDEMWQNIKNGYCGIDEIKLIDTTNHKVKIAGEVKNLRFEDYLDKKQIQRADRFTNLGLIAAKQAFIDSKLKKGEFDSHELGVMVGSGIGGLKTIEETYSRGLERGFDKISPFFIPKTISDIAAGNIAIEISAKAICSCIVTACASGSNSIGEAFRNIRDGYTSMIFAGGSEATITHLGIGGFTSLTALCQNNDISRASIPFDKERSGFVMGEGAAIVVLEELEHAKERKAKIYGEIVGYGASCDAYHITAPAEDGEGAILAMEIAIKDANVKKEDIKYINAHGTSTLANDKIEVEAIKNVFKGCIDDLAISSTKSMTGHLLGASGALEAVISIKAIIDGFMPPTINYKVRDLECDMDVVPNVGRHRNLEYVMSNSFGFGGHNASLIFKRWSQ